MREFKIALSLFVFGLLLLPSVSYAGSSPYTSSTNCLPNTPTSECKYPNWCTVYQALAGDTCAINSYPNQAVSGCSPSNWLKQNMCPATTDTALDGNYAAIFGGGPTPGSVWKFNELSDAGRWDASDSKIVTCNGAMEDQVWGDASGLQCASGGGGAGGCLPQSGDGNCESACGAPSQLDEASSSTSQLFNVQCNGGNTIAAGQQFTITYQASGTSSQTENQKILQGSNLVQSYPAEDISTCTLSQRSRTLTAPSSAGSYVYTVNAYSSNPNYPDSWKSCILTVVQCKIDSDCVALNPVPTCGPPVGNYPDRYAQCNTDNTCTKCGACSYNSDCGAGYCCVDAKDDTNAPLTGSGQCKSKSILSSETPSTGKPASSYLCDPGEWIKCDYSKINANYTFNNNTYTCTLESGDYKWVVTPGVPQQQPKASLFEIIVQFFKSLFR